MYLYTVRSSGADPQDVPGSLCAWSSSGLSHRCGLRWKEEKRAAYRAKGWETLGDNCDETQKKRHSSHVETYTERC